jgi:CRISPR/Cas system-associated exonuclease Cas4 (RecB family)
MGLITQWSYSRYQSYCDCPYKTKLKIIDKLPEPGSPQMDRGTAIHKMAEDFVKAKEKGPLPQELAYFGDELSLAREGRPICEMEWAFTNTWEPTGWFSKDCWCRVKTDLAFNRSGRMVIVDHKTGKRRDSHLTQLSLYALAGFIMFEKANEIDTEVWYLDQGKPNAHEEYNRSDLPFLKMDWEQKTKALLNDEQFAPLPSFRCKWCSFRKENGGPCQY